MWAKLISMLGGAALSALTDFFSKRASERKLRSDLKKLGRLEERDENTQNIHETAKMAARIKMRIATDPAYRERVREQFTRR